MYTMYNKHAYTKYIMHVHVHVHAIFKSVYMQALTLVAAVSVVCVVYLSVIVEVQSTDERS